VISWMMRRGRLCNKAVAREKVDSPCPSALSAS
jgi:hypothetical protein